jgi:hypothetical protein
VVCPPDISDPCESQHIKWIEGRDLGVLAKVRVVERQESRHAVLDHHGDQARIVCSLAADGVLGNQALPYGIDLWSFGQ